MNEYSKKKKLIVYYLAPIFFIITSFIMLFSLNCYNLRTIYCRNLKNIFLHSTANFFAIHNVQIIGNKNINTQIIKEMVYEYEHIFNINLEEIALKIRALGWPQNIEIIRQLPHTIKIIITEKTPIFRWSIDNKYNHYYFIDQNGLIINDDAKDDLSLPIIYNSYGQIEYLVQLFKNNTEFTNYITEISYDKNWLITLNNHVNLLVSMMQIQELSEVLQYLDKKYSIFDDNIKLEFIDARNIHKIYTRKK